jgi:glyoxylase-like metal-dependent hydrolase (beta-lactamase superfamily II)
VGAAAGYGHTPGHTLILVENGGAKLLIWGDLMHVELVQFPLPDTAVTYDSDPAAATVSRKQALAWAVRNKAAIAGSHLVYPALGTVQQDGAGYRFVTAK